MTRKKKALTVQADLSEIFVSDQTKPTRTYAEGFTVEKALSAVIRQMKAAGLRERTISDYETYVNDFIEKTGVEILNQITADDVYAWLASMDVSNQTKLTRLKCLKAFFSRCFNNGWIESKFWNSIRIKVDNPVKEGATDKEINILLSMLDLTDFVQLRDATAVLLMYQTGIRVGTLARLENKHINFETNLLKIDGGIIKNHESIFLPFDDVLARLLTVLIQQNDLVRKENRVKNELVFITTRGTTVISSPTNNVITKRLNKYSRDFGLKNISPHALRRGFAKNLLKKGANIALISKALGHSDLAVTTRYLHLDKAEVAENLRKFL
jgi:integrase/recombinase XerD